MCDLSPRVNTGMDFILKQLNVDFVPSIQFVDCLEFVVDEVQSKGLYSLILNPRQSHIVSLHIL